jgi:hypothetical protein
MMHSGIGGGKRDGRLVTRNLRKREQARRVYETAEELVYTTQLPALTSSKPDDKQRKALYKM